jgi:hypothetical protein
MNSATLETSQENMIVGAVESATPRVEYVNLHRDDRDVRLLLQMSFSEILIVIALLASIACNFWQYFRRPDRIIVDRRNDGDYVVSINDQSVTSDITAGPDKPGEGDKQRLANEWAMARYAVDPAQREQAVERLLRMMEPNAAAKFVAYLKRNGELERERGERWQSSWKPQLTVVDSNDPNRVNIVGQRELSKVISGVPANESTQFMFSLKVMPDKDSGRAAHNLHTGYLVLDIMDLREVTSGNSGDSVLPQR